MSTQGSTSSRIPKFSSDEIRTQIRSLGEWFHNMDLLGVKTAPNHFLGDYPTVKWKRFASEIPNDLHGKTVLDIGCNGGFYSIEMKRRGALRVVGIDSDAYYLAQARFAANVCGLDIEFLKMSVFDVAALGERFDYVLFMGVIYHLRHPLLALDLIHAHVAKDIFVFQSLQRGSTKVEPLDQDYSIKEEKIFDRRSYPRLHFIEHRYSGDPTNWWIPNTACAQAMLRSAGFKILSHPEKEVYICQRGDRPDTSVDYCVYPARPEMES